MTEERWDEAEETGKVTDEELAAGWHFCPEYDYLLINYNDPQHEGVCNCKESE